MKELPIDQVCRVKKLNDKNLDYQYVLMIIQWAKLQKTYIGGIITPTVQPLDLLRETERLTHDLRMRVRMRDDLMEAASTWWQLRGKRTVPSTKIGSNVHLLERRKYNIFDDLQGGGLSCGEKMHRLGFRFYKEWGRWQRAC